MLTYDPDHDRMLFHGLPSPRMRLAAPTTTSAHDAAAWPAVFAAVRPALPGDPAVAFARRLYEEGQPARLVARLAYESPAELAVDESAAEDLARRLAGLLASRLDGAMTAALFRVAAGVETAEDARGFAAVLQAAAGLARFEERMDAVLFGGVDSERVAAAELALDVMAGTPLRRIPRVLASAPLAASVVDAFARTLARGDE